MAWMIGGTIVAVYAVSAVIVWAMTRDQPPERDWKREANAPD